ncbi:hypothetical protein AVEN_168336-1 [Araneus ventricosus]|uniref:Uncharacterized protein n=1 Tax=Araneus ventricosus TaxID=182803 RepID=A0A4Y2QH37_ARAVE|nr:hypothetical protein AVEN_168336-1 [Araneus ventricosus]
MRAGLRRLVSFEGRRGSEIAKDIRAVEGPIILSNHSSFQCALRGGYRRGWSSGVNDHPGWESPIHVAPFQKLPVLKELEVKSLLGIKESNCPFSS